MKIDLKPFWQRLYAPVDAASLSVFRIGFGLLLLVDVVRYWGLIDRLYLQPEFQFTYYGFGWVAPLPGEGLYVLFLALGLFSLMIIAGLMYRLAMVLFTVGFIYIYLLDQAMYLNHFYLVILICLMMCLLPANRHLALDVRLGRTRCDGTVPRWAVWAPRSLFEIVLIYAGLVKVDADWLSGYPLIYWLGAHADWPLIGPLLGSASVAVLASWATVLLHLVGAPMLLWKRTRLAAFVLYCGFHVANAMLWKIGIFPWLTIAGTLMFFPPDWPRQLAAWLDRSAAPRRTPATGPMHAPGRAERWAVHSLALFLVLNILIPMRPLLYPGKVAWTTEGQRFAWRMKLFTDRGRLHFIVRDRASASARLVEPPPYLTARQRGVMVTHPDMILQLAHHIAERARIERGEDVEVFAVSMKSLNGRPYARFIDPNVDLTRVERNLLPASWIVPFDRRLKPGTLDYQ